MEKWDKRFLELCDHVSTWSRDPSRKVGAVIVNDGNIVVGMGYNGFPRHIPDYDDVYNDSIMKNQMIVHAELNAILNANSVVKGCTIYTNFFTCHECAKSIVQSGIKRVVSFNHEDDGKWLGSFKLARKMYILAGIDVVAYDR